MQFIQDVNYDEFNSFVLSHKKSHFMQSPAWGEFSRVQKGMTVHRVALAEDDGTIRAAALLLERKPSFLPPYLYCPRGYVIDFDDIQLLRTFTEHIRSFAKSRHAMFVALDPDLERRQIREDGGYDEGGFDNSGFVDIMHDLGYRHRGWNLGFEGREPRFTFRIDLDRDTRSIEKAFTGNVLKNIKKSRHYAVRVYEGGSEDIPKLYDMITRTGERDKFVPYGPEYYQNFYDCLARDGIAHLYIGAVDPSATVTMLEQELQDTLSKRLKLKKEGPLQESYETEARLNREIALFRKYSEEYQGEVTVSAHLVARYGGKSWAVHAGSAGIMDETFCNNRVYYEKLMAQKEAGCSFLDMFGTVGNPQEEGPFKSVHAFKRQWGGRYIEFMGQFDLVTRPFWYFTYEKLRPAYRNLRFDLIELKKKLTHE